LVSPFSGLPGFFNSCPILIGGGKKRNTPFSADSESGSTTEQRDR
jgi:hypothetical protein